MERNGSGGGEGAVMTIAHALRRIEIALGKAAGGFATEGTRIATGRGTRASCFAGGRAEGTASVCTRAGDSFTAGLAGIGCGDRGSASACRCAALGVTRGQFVDDRAEKAAIERKDGDDLRAHAAPTGGEPFH